ncbi:MAG: hypothetical protein WKF43_02080 [Acidimicrobiales bacterium]
MAEPPVHTEHEDAETREDADEAGPDASHGPGHFAAEAVGPDEHDEHDEHDGGAHASGHGDDADHPAENPSWVLVPLLVGLVIGVVVLVILGFSSAAPA